MAVIGNTAKVRCDFTNWSGVATDPSSATMSIYDNNKTLITSSAITASSKVSLGTYEAFFVIPDRNGFLTVEVDSIIETVIAVNRQNVILNFANGVA